MTTACFCTLAIHEPYRKRARVLCEAIAPAPMVVLTDEPKDFAGLAVRAIRHAPTGPMAIDYQRLGIDTGTGAAAYHDKRFALQAALADCRTATYLDADSSIEGPVGVERLPPGLAVRPAQPESIAEHLAGYGRERLPLFEDLACELCGSTSVLDEARWIYEDCFAVTRDERAPRFFEAWDRGAAFMQHRGLYSGEGGVIGLAAAYAGWPVDFQVLAGVARVIRHERYSGARRVHGSGPSPRA